MHIRAHEFMHMGVMGGEEHGEVGGENSGPGLTRIQDVMIR